MENNTFQKVTNFLLKYGIIIISIIVGIIGILSIFVTAYFDSTFSFENERTSFKYTFGIVEILIVVFVVLLITILNKIILKKIPSKVLLIFLLIGTSIIFVYWIKLLKLTPENDQKLIHEMAISFLDGKIGYYLQRGLYLFLYPYQFGLTFFVSIIYKIFGIDYMNILFINCVCSIINMIIIFKISKILFNDENIQKILVILLSVFALYWMFFNVHFYGNIIGLTFALLAVLFTIFYLEKNKRFYLVLSGIFISIAIILKSNYQIFLCGIILILTLDIIKKWNSKALLIVLIFLIGYFSINLGYSYILKYNDVNLPEGVPMIAFVYMGMDEPTSLSPGWYNGVTVSLYGDNNFDSEQTTEETVKIIKNRIQYFGDNPKEFISYYSQKIGSTWLNPTFQTIWCSLPGIRYVLNNEYAEYINNHPTLISMLSGEYYKLEEQIFNIYQIIIFSFASIGIFKLSKDIDLSGATLIIIFIGGFIFHIIWETKAIYVIQYYFLLLPFAALGLDYFSNKIYFVAKESFKKINRKKQI